MIDRHCNIRRPRSTWPSSSVYGGECHNQYSSLIWHFQVVFWTTLEVVFLETNSARLNLIVRCFPLIWLMGVHAENCYIRDTNRTHSLTPLLIFSMDNGPKKLKIFGMWYLIVQLILSLKSVEMVKIVGSCCLSVIISSSSSLSRRILSERGAVWEGSQGGEE